MKIDDIDLTVYFVDWVILHLYEFQALSAGTF